MEGAILEVWADTGNESLTIMFNQVTAGHTPLHEYIFIKGNSSSSEDDP
jgi:hypothetical protein